MFMKGGRGLHQRLLPFRHVPRPFVGRLHLPSFAFDFEFVSSADASCAINYTRETCASSGERLIVLLLKPFLKYFLAFITVIYEMFSPKKVIFLKN